MSTGELRAAVVDVTSCAIGALDTEDGVLSAVLNAVPFTEKRQHLHFFGGNFRDAVAVAVSPRDASICRSNQVVAIATGSDFATKANVKRRKAVVGVFRLSSKREEVVSSNQFYSVSLSQSLRHFPRRGLEAVVYLDRL